MHSYSPSASATQRRAHPLRLGALAIIVLVTFATAAIGSIASIQAVEFYASLNRPSWAPPANVFGPAWTTLFTLMAIAAWIVVRVDGWPQSKPKMFLYGTQLAFNALWSWLFFRWHSGMAAFAEVIVLWLFIAATIVAFWRTHKLAGALLLPYIAWVSFATALTWSVWQANRGTL